MRRFLLTALLGLVPFVLLAAPGGCGSTQPPIYVGKDGANDVFSDRSRIDGPIRPDAACEVVIDAPAIVDSPHLDIGTVIQYSSNPPSSGPHYPIWAGWQEFTTPVPRPFWVHSLEHGAVVLLYNCALLAGADAGSDATDEDASADGEVDADAGPSACTTLVDQLRTLMNALPDDPLCDKDSGPSHRIILTPDPLIDRPVAAAAWGWTYNAACFDRASLEQFAKDHYAKAPENFCTNGQTFF